MNNKEKINKIKKITLATTGIVMGCIIIYELDEIRKILLDQTKGLHSIDIGISRVLEMGVK